MKGIYRRGSVYWICYKGPDDRVMRESSRSSKFRDAQTLLTKRKNEILEGKVPEVKRIPKYTFGQLVSEYKKWGIRQRGFYQKENIIKQLDERFKHYPLRRFSTQMVEQYQTERLTAGYQKPKLGEEPKPNSAATVNRHIATLKHMFTKAVDWCMVEEDVLKRIRKVKMIQENNRRLRYLMPDESQKLVSFCDAWLKPIVITALNTGMRKGEILSLKWDNVDMRNRFILLDKTKNGQRREIPINDSLWTVLKQLERRLDIPYVFFNPQTLKPYDTIRPAFMRACKKAGIYDFRFHDLRHTFASGLVMAGIDLTTVKELLGHRDLTMTLRYAHLAPAHKVNAVNVLDQQLNGDSLHNYFTIGAKKEGVNHV